MTRIGVTGHSKLTPESVPFIATALRDVLREHGNDLTGVTCLARGADQVFAQAVLDVGGTIEVILPSQNYRNEKIKPENREQFEKLYAQAARVHVLPHATADRDAYVGAGETLLSSVDTLVAVWDGAAPDGKGGTGDTVRAARGRSIPVTVVWPDGAARDG
ncbi:MAG: hypothetical protein ACRDRK_10640 [Pseudonocardia sp.]